MGIDILKSGRGSLRKVKSEQDLGGFAKANKKSLDIDDDSLREILHHVFILFKKKSDAANKQADRTLLFKASVYEAITNFTKVSGSSEIQLKRKEIAGVFLQIADKYLFDFFIKPQNYPAFYKKIQEAKEGTEKREVLVAFIQDKISLENQSTEEKIKQFRSVYLALLKGAGKKEHEQALTKEIDAIKVENDGEEEDEINKKIYSAIQRYVKKHPNSSAAFSWSHSQDFHSGKITSEELFKQVYEESFQRSGFFSISKISGQTVFFKSSLHRALEGKNLFDLFDPQKPGSEETRTGKVYYELGGMDSFNK